MRAKSESFRNGGLHANAIFCVSPFFVTLKRILNQIGHLLQLQVSTAVTSMPCHDDVYPGSSSSEDDTVVEFAHLDDTVLNLPGGMSRGEASGDERGLRG